ncbi:MULTISPECIES: 3-hexulose-6-phosphate synthase [unclassified Cryobacterium]|uniref:3-hexulose-6-phosphate synthase n=1 Tax=unclassified Cryobacterium TaxID=2649013 RepID=UPI00106B5596|nr:MULTISPECIES: 3-hexulose-6-phosphate synthase [unclassified Cryobacterium]TFC00951.1 3-hexulose-6-phosphate synthase [Cryobacterium sp. MDB2-A-1]TFC13131.1 3-hexulose-6-phosphate synthase [Cryobacterium sp. MDB2-A-2]TFC23941.1 3-hexulose-6-phosphate synthase [Cryobacterium sp. MDB2-10]
MKLQVAMDVTTLDAAITLAAQVAPHVDIIELGTPLIKSEGLRAVTAIKNAHPDKLVFADLKTMDAGELEADLAFTAGADYVTVLGTAGDSTIVGAVKAATAHGKGIVVDLIGVADKVTRAREVTGLGAVFVEMHAGLDEQAEPGFTFQTLLNDGETAKVPFSVAGGVNLSTIRGVQRAGATVAVAGGAIYGAADPAASAAELRAAII